MRGTARQDLAAGPHPLEGFLGRGKGRDLAADARLADAACDELGGLTAEIDDQDAVLPGLGHGVPDSRCADERKKPPARLFGDERP